MLSNYELRLSFVIFCPVVNGSIVWQTLVGEDIAVQRNVSRKMSLVIGARRHLEWGHEKYIMDTIQSHPVQVIKLFIKILVPVDGGVICFHEHALF